MVEQSHTGRVPQKTMSENLVQANLSKQLDQKPSLGELDGEIGVPRCTGVIELNTSFDALVYFCKNCSFILKCV